MPTVFFFLFLSLKCHEITTCDLCLNVVNDSYLVKDNQCNFVPKCQSERIKCSRIVQIKKIEILPIFFIEFLTQNVIFRNKSLVTKHEFWGLLTLKSQYPMLLNLKWNMKWYTFKKESGVHMYKIYDYIHIWIFFVSSIPVLYTIGW